MRRYEDFFVTLAENRMKSELVEYCSVNIRGVCIPMLIFTVLFYLH